MLCWLRKHSVLSLIHISHKHGFVRVPLSEYRLVSADAQAIFGEWNPDKAVLMSDANFPEWQIEDVYKRQ